MAQKNLVVRAAREIVDERTVDLDGIDGQALQVAQRRMAGAEIVERDAAAGVAQRADEPGRFLDIVERRGFGDLDNEARGDVGPVAHLRDQRAQPRPIGRGQARNVEAEPDGGMSVELRHHHIEDIAVDQPDKTKLFEFRHEFAGRNDPAVRRAHPQEALVMVDFLGCGHDHRLEGKQDALFAQRRLHLVADRQAAPLALALLTGHAIMAVAVAPGALGFGERALRPGDRVVGGQTLIGKRGAADRRRGIDVPPRRQHRPRADRGQDLLGRRPDIFLPTMRQDDAETVAAEPADQIADAQAAVEPPADFDQHAIGRLIAEHVVDHRHVVDSDRQERGRAVGALIGGDDLVDRFAQPGLVEMTGQLVVIRQPLEARLLRLAVADRTDDSEHDRRSTRIITTRPAALVHPDEAAFGVAQAVFAVERILAVEMPGERQLAVDQIIGMDAIGKAASGRHLRRQIDHRGSQPPRPLNPIPVEFPGIGDIACRLQRRRATDCHLVVANGHRPTTSIELAACPEAAAAHYEHSRSEMLKNS